MDLHNFQRLLGWVGLLALAIGSLAALTFWLRFRAWSAAVVFLAMGTFVAAALLVEVFPAYRLGTHPETGQQVLMAQNQTLHMCLFAIMGAAALSFAAGLWWLLFSVVPKRHAGEAPRP